MAHALEAFHLSKSFGTVRAVHDLSMHVDEGEVVGLIGANGAGKSVTVRMLAGLMRPTSGNYAIFSNIMPRDDAGVRRKVAYLSQSLDFPEPLFVRDVLAMCEAVYPDWDKQFMDKLVSDFSLPLGRKARELSVGMKLRLSLVCAFAQRAGVILLDEPAGSLDPVVRNEFLENLAETLERHSPAVLFATHLMHSLERLVDRVVLLREGSLAYEEDMVNVAESYRRVQVVFEDTVPRDFSLPSVISSETRGRTWTGVISDYSAESVARICSNANATFEAWPIFLEDLFIALHQRPKGDRP
ncbi:MAG: ABC transporter ATP-binding protein [Planctomycetota bacterium]|nr:ABC transporter ATP-binding protein [Planctomycetota bacterium]